MAPLHPSGWTKPRTSPSLGRLLPPCLLGGHEEEGRSWEESTVDPEPLHEAGMTRASSKAEDLSAASRSRITEGLRAQALETVGHI